MGLVVAAAAGAVVYDLSSEPVSPPGERSGVPTLAGRTVFCPPDPAGVEGESHLGLSSASRGDVSVRVEPPTLDRAVDAGRFLLLRPPGEDAPSVSAFGGSIAAHWLGSLREPTEAVVAARCSSSASDRWYFAAGSSALGFDERLLISNPFLDEAVVRVVFYTRTGPRAKAGLADVAVPAGRSVQVAANDYILRRSLLAAEVEARRGRVVTWREQLGRRRPHTGAVLTLGAPAPAASWYFPEGMVGEGHDERIAVLNPSAQEAVVTITLASEGRVVQPPELVELSLAPGTAREVALSEAVPIPRRPLSVGAVVRSVNGVDVVAERTLVYATERLRGMAAEMGATTPARRWHLSPATLRPRRDEVVVLNPGTRAATVRALLLRRSGAPLAPRALRAVLVPAGLTKRISVARWTKGKPMAAVVTSDRAVVVERFATSRGTDVAAAMGTRMAPHRQG